MVLGHPTSVLVVEDEASQGDAVARGLVGAGLRVSTARGLPQTLAKLASECPDVVLIEMSDPSLHRLDVCRQVRKRSDVPIVVLTVPSPEIYVAVGLEIGADHYLTRPVATRELVARIAMVLRRGRRAPADTGRDPVQVGEVRLDPQSHTVTVSGRVVALTLKEFAVLQLLLERAGRVIPRRVFLDRVWGSELRGNNATLETHIKRVRAKIANGHTGPSAITTVRGVGYLYEDRAAHRPEMGQNAVAADKGGT